MVLGVSNQHRSNRPTDTVAPLSRLNNLLWAGRGVIHVPDLHPSDKRRVLRWCREGRIIRIMRGLYVENTTPEVIVAAVARAYPDAVFVGETAAWLNGQTPGPPNRVTAIHRGRSHRFAHFRLIRSAVDDDLWAEQDGIRRLTPAAAALYVVPDRGPGLLDTFMRTAKDRVGALRHITDALAATPGRVGNVIRRRIVARTGTNPWSAFERTLHDILDGAGITGWVANEKIDADGHECHPDVRFEAEKVVLEADGFQFHTGREVFISDRRRQNALVLDGWLVLRFTWWDLAEPERIVDQVTRALCR